MSRIVKGLRRKTKSGWNLLQTAVRWTTYFWSPIRTNQKTKQKRVGGVGGWGRFLRTRTVWHSIHTVSTNCLSSLQTRHGNPLCGKPRNQQQVNVQSSIEAKKKKKKVDKSFVQAFRVIYLPDSKKQKTDERTWYTRWLRLQQARQTGPWKGN